MTFWKSSSLLDSTDIIDVGDVISDLNIVSFARAKMLQRQAMLMSIRGATLSSARGVIPQQLEDGVNVTPDAWWNGTQPVLFNSPVRIFFLAIRFFQIISFAIRASSLRLFKHQSYLLQAPLAKIWLNFMTAINSRTEFMHRIQVPLTRVQVGKPHRCPVRISPCQTQWLHAQNNAFSCRSPSLKVHLGARQPCGSIRYLLLFELLFHVIYAPTRKFI